MAESFRDAMERAVWDAQALVTHLDGLGSSEHATPAAVGRAESLAAAIEGMIAHAEECYAESAANGAAYRALEGLDAMHAAARGNDVPLMRAVAHEVLDHLIRARDLSASSGGGQ